jgi:hypothetical protein
MSSMSAIVAIMATCSPVQNVMVRWPRIASLRYASRKSRRGYGCGRNRPWRQNCIPCLVSEQDQRSAITASSGVTKPTRSSRWQVHSTRLAAAKQTRVKTACGCGVEAGGAPGEPLRRWRSTSVDGRLQISIGVVRARRAARISAAVRIRSGSVGQVDSLRNAIIAPSLRYWPTASWATLIATRTTATTR